MNEFLKQFPDHIIATLDDKATKGADPKREAKRELMSNQYKRNWTLEELQNLNKQGAGIFFAYNGIKEKRLIENVTQINAWAMEVDNIPKEDQYKKLIKCPLSPSIIVESANSYHSYWLAKNGTIQNAKKINTALCQYFNSDPALKDISRLLRIPGFYHNKREPFLVKAILTDYENRFTEDEMLGNYPYQEKVIKSIISKQNYTKCNSDDFWQALNRIPAMVGLERLSNTKAVNNESFSFRTRPGGGFYIDVNNEQADAWIDENGLIGSGKGASPTIVNWLRYYGLSFKEIAEISKDIFKDLLPESTKTFQFQKKEIETEPKTFIPYTWGTPFLDNNIWALKPHEVVCLAGITSSGKTAYAYYLARKNAELGHKVCYVVLEMSRDEIIDRLASDCADFTIEEDRLENFPEEKKKIYNQKKEEMNNLKNLIMLDMPNATIEDIFNKIMETKDFDMVFIDNFDRIKKSKNILNDFESDNHKIKTILNFSGTQHIPTFIIHHINSKRPAKKGGYGLSDLRGSGKITDECNTVFYLSRDLRDEAEEYEKKYFFIQAKKHRRKGQLANVSIYFDKGEFSDFTMSTLTKISESEEDKTLPF